MARFNGYHAAAEFEASLTDRMALNPPTKENALDYLNYIRTVETTIHMARTQILETVVVQEGVPR